MAKRERKRNVVIYQILKYISVICMIVFVVMQFSANKESTTDFDTMQTAVTKAADLSKMEEGDNQKIKRFYGLDPAQLDGVLYYTPASNMEAEELLLIKLKNVDQASMVEEAIESRLATQKKNFDGYGTYQTAMLNDSQIVVRGNYILFVSAEDPDKVVDAFTSHL